MLIASVIAAVALAEAGVGLLTRWLSSTIGEGLILDLRTAVFDHVQRMPVAFFTRTRTGALVSRLGNDVIGAQRAFSDTLSGVVSNLVTLALTLAVMLEHLVADHRAVAAADAAVPAARAPDRPHHGDAEPRERDLQRDDEHPDDRTVLGARRHAGQAVRRSGAGVARSSRSRADRVRDIGVKTSMLQATFMNSLTLMSALALALVYGLGGVLAIGGHLQAGAIVSLALLLTRLYAPLTALANAHVEIASALVSFERVFEVLDLVPLIREKADAVAVPDGPVGVEFDDVRFAYPSADKVSLASLEEVAVLDDRGGDEVLHGISFTAEPGQMVALVGSSGAGKSTIASLVARLYDVDSGAVRLAGTDVRDVTFASLKETVGVVTQDGHLFHESIRANLTLAAPDATDDELWEALRRARLADVVGRHARRARHRRRRARLPALGRAAAAVDHRAAAARHARGSSCSTRRPRRWTRSPRPRCSRRSPRRWRAGRRS